MTIHTNTYGDRTKNIMIAMFKLIHDCGYYAVSSKSIRAAARARVTVAPNGEILIDHNRDGSYSYYRIPCAFRNNDNKKACELIAYNLKQLLLKEKFDSTNVSKFDVKEFWNRTNTNVSEWFKNAVGEDVTINELYCLYDILLNRKRILRNFDIAVIESIKGEENDPFKTEMEVQKRAEIERINKEYQEQIDKADVTNYSSELYSELTKELDMIRSKYKAKSKELMDALKAERDQKLQELNDMLNF